MEVWKQLLHVRQAPKLVASIRLRYQQCRIHRCSAVADSDRGRRHRPEDWQQLLLRLRSSVRPRQPPSNKRPSQPEAVKTR